MTGVDIWVYLIIMLGVEEWTGLQLREHTTKLSAEMMLQWLGEPGGVKQVVLAT